MNISNLTKIEATGKIDNQFVGLRIHNNQIEFHYPETYQLSEDDTNLRKDIISILRTISLAKTKTREKSTYYTSHGENAGFPLRAFLWIINDYLVYGRYENREKEYVRGVHHKVNWKKTMKSNPVVSEGNVIYTDIVSEKKTQKDSLLSEIYYFCVQRSTDAIGWLYGVSFDSQGVDYYKLFNSKRYLGAINTELLHTFDDQKKIRLQNMKDVIEGLDDNLSSTYEVVYGVDSYEYVYERMIDKLFSNIENKNDFYPRAEWDLVLVPNTVPSTNLRPDTVIEMIDPVTTRKKVFIIDAKYYRYGTTFKSGDMPETTSIQKQITYGEYVKAAKKGQYEGVYSAFVLPYSKETNAHNERLNRNMEFVGIGKAKWFEDEGLPKDTNRKIAAILIDTKFLISNWMRRDEDNINTLVQLIEQHVKAQ